MLADSTTRTPFARFALISERWAWWIFLLLLLLLCLPPWMFDYFPTQDGPTHLYNVQMLLGYSDPAHAAYSQFHSLNNSVDPTWFGHAVIAVLILICGNVLLAHKVLLTGYVLLFGFALRYFTGSVNPGNRYLALLGLPFIYSQLFNKGFYAFSFSIPVALIMLGFWFRHHPNWKPVNTLGLAILSLLLYFTHPISMMTAYFAVAAMGGVVILQYWSGNNWRLEALWSAMRSQVLPLVIAFLPTLIMLFMFVGGRESLFFYDNPPWVRAQHLVALSTLISYQPVELVFTLILTATFTVLGLFSLLSLKSHANRMSMVLLAAVITTGLIALLFPEQELITPGSEKTAGYYYMQRLQAYPYLLALGWLAFFDMKPGLRSLAVVAAVISTVGLLGLHSLKYTEFHGYVEEWLSGAEYVPANSSVLQLNLSRNYDRGPDGQLLSEFVAPLQHGSNWLCLRRNAVCFENFETNSGYFPLRFRPELDPYVHIGEFHELVPTGQFVDYTERTGAPLDFVMVWQSNDDRGLDYSQLKNQLEIGFDLIHVSPQNAYLKLYRRKDWGNDPD